METAPTHRIAYSVSEVRQLTGIGKTKLYQLIADGQLGSRKIGRRRLIPAAELDVLLGLEARASPD